MRIQRHANPKSHFLLKVGRKWGAVCFAFRWILWGALSGLLSMLEAQAQVVHLTDLLQQTILTHPSVLQARSQAQAAGFDLDAAKWGRYPSLSSEVRSDSNFAQSIVKLEQPLWTGGRIDGRIQLGQVSLRSAEASVRDAEFNALTQVAGAFFDWLRLDDRHKSALQNVKEHERLFQLIDRRVKSDISPPADATLAQARLQQAESERLQIQRQQENTLNTLVQWAGPLKGSPKAPRGITYMRAASGQTLAELVVQMSPQRQKLLAQIESAQAKIRLAEAQGMPSVVVGYQHIVSGPLYNSPDRGRSYVGMQFQPGAGLSTLSGVQSALASKDAAEQELLVFERSLEFQAKSLYSDIDVLQAQLGPAQALMEGTGELVDSYLRQYQIGRKSWLDVLNALREKTQALYNLADVRYSLLQSQIRLMLLTGELNGTNNAVIHE